MAGAAVLHALAGAPGSPLGGLLGDGLEQVATHRPLVGPTRRVIGRVSGPPALLERAGSGLPSGAAHAEATAVRLRHLGLELEWGAPDTVESVDELLAICRHRGASSVAIARTDPALLVEMQIGAWFQAGWRGRALRRLARAAPGGGLPSGRALPSRPLAVRIACDLAFWAGVRGAATGAEWRRLTASSYVMLVYHRLAGEGKAGQERIDIDPRRFETHLVVLRRLGFTHLSAEDVLAFHHPGASKPLPRLSFAVTFDDGFLDVRETLLARRELGPQLFVCTQEVGGSARWAGGEPVMDWPQVAELADAGVAVGAHSRRHERLVELTDAALEESLRGSLADLRERIAEPLEVLAYPNGAHDARVRRVASEAGFRAAYTTEKGRNGVGTDPFCLRRTSVHATDGPVAIVWKALTGEGLPRLLRRAPAPRARA